MVFDADMPAKAGTAKELAWLREMCRTGKARELRLAVGLSLAEIGEDYASPPTVYRWEMGQQVPRGEQARRYARVLRQVATLASTGQAS